MGKPTGKKTKSSGGKLSKSNSKNRRSNEQRSPKILDEDTTMFMGMAHDMKEEGNKLFQRRDYDGALLKYDKAIKLLPKNHMDVAYLHTNIAACYMHMGPGEHHLAINECNLALEISPKYTKALLKRARCYEALDRLNLACQDVDQVLSLEPNNLTALEISERVKIAIEKRGLVFDEKVISLPDVRVVRERKKKKKTNKAEGKVTIKEAEVKLAVKEAEEKVAVKEEKQNQVKEDPSKVVKLIFGEDIRCAQLPAKYSMLQLREIVGSKFPSLRSILIKYRDKEGDLVTITTSEELRWAVESAEPQGSLRLYITEVNPEHEPIFEEIESNSSMRGLVSNPNNSITENGSKRFDVEKGFSTYIDDYILQFARLFKNHVGFDSDGYLNIHELGMKLYSEALEDTITSEEAQEIFDLTEEKFQEMAALALFNWGNVHMSRASKKMSMPGHSSNEPILDQAKVAYELSKAEYVKAGKRYEEALKIKPDFYEAILALGQQQFEQAKLSWCYAIGSKADLATWPSKEVFELFNNAENNIEMGKEMWDEMEEQRLKRLSKLNDEKLLLQQMGLDDYFIELSAEEVAEHSSNMRSQINILWGTILYERSVVEFKLGIPVWEDCLMAAVEKFKLAGASLSDISVMIKNHCANETAQEGLSFRIDEIVQAWNEMYDAKRWIDGVSSFRLRPLFRRRIPKLHDMLENVRVTVHTSSFKN